MMNIELFSTAEEDKQTVPLGKTSVYISLNEYSSVQIIKKKSILLSPIDWVKWKNVESELDSWITK